MFQRAAAPAAQAAEEPPRAVAVWDGQSSVVSLGTPSRVAKWRGYVVRHGYEVEFRMATRARAFRGRVAVRDGKPEFIIYRSGREVARGNSANYVIKKLFPLLEVPGTTVFGL